MMTEIGIALLEAAIVAAFLAVGLLWAGVCMGVL